MYGVPIYMIKFVRITNLNCLKWRIFLTYFSCQLSLYFFFPKQPKVDVTSRNIKINSLTDVTYVR